MAVASKHSKIKSNLHLFYLFFKPKINFLSSFFALQIKTRQKASGSQDVVKSANFGLELQKSFWQNVNKS